ncbi:class I SAM-dependent methyltransferase [Simplicispira psychrophila]|uniref:class I SAM-dependent methyltransferase n=1 Tax=Simplicispira psychrophila TaxID=80882 RepID=UPI00048724B6|nr:class I SAM-dependent methyltransferase [Simplicispira psychrophila]
MSVPVLIHLLRERLAWHSQPRVPEPDLVMESVAQTTSFSAAGETNGALAFLYLYNALQITSLLQPGDSVLDLACGPAHQLAQIASLNLGVQFIGVDASAAMLACAQQNLARAQVENVALVQGDMTRLVGQTDGSMDCVMCTMSLHHLPDQAALRAALQEIRRVLKPQGRLYLVDFGRLKLRSTQHFFAHDLQQSVQFTEDYFNSLQAAFSVEELTAAVALLGPDVQRHATVLAPLMVVFRTAFRRSVDRQALLRAKVAFASLSAKQQDDFRGLAQWFRLSGYALPCDLEAG